MGWGKFFKGLGQAALSGAGVGGAVVAADPAHFNPLNPATWVTLGSVMSAGAVVGVINHLSKSPTQSTDSAVVDALVGQYKVVVTAEPTKTGGNHYRVAVPAFNLVLFGDSEEQAKMLAREAVRSCITGFVQAKVPLPKADV